MKLPDKKRDIDHCHVMHGHNDNYYMGKYDRVYLYQYLTYIHLSTPIKYAAYNKARLGADVPRMYLWH